jgi:hypothetical protein
MFIYIMDKAKNNMDPTARHRRTTTTTTTTTAFYNNNSLSYTHHSITYLMVSMRMIISLAVSVSVVGVNLASLAVLAVGLFVPSGELLPVVRLGSVFVTSGLVQIGGNKQNGATKTTNN